jgi:hypothetical protein
MRRLLRSLAKGETITQHISTLENPAILDQLAQPNSGSAMRRLGRHNDIHKGIHGRGRRICACPIKTVSEQLASELQPPS